MGGGVLLAVRDCFSVREITNIDGLTPDMELIFAIIGVKHRKLLCCVVYLPPNYNDDQYLRVLACIENAVLTYASINVLILGDFNLNSCTVNIKTNFNSFCDFCGLQQFNNVYNNRGGMLDLVLSDLSLDQMLVSVGPEPLVPIDEYHPPIEVLIRFPCGSVATPVPSSSPAPLSTSSRYSWNWRKADLQGLYTALQHLDWSELFLFNDIEIAIDIFYTNLYNCISLYVPVKTDRMKDSKYVYPKWYTPDIIHNIRQKYYHLKRYKADGNTFNKELFKYYRWHVKNLVDNAYKQHLHLTERKIADDPAKFWEFIKDRKNDRRFVEFYSFRNEEVTGQAAADAFAEYFSSVFQSEVPLLNPLDASLAASIHVDATLISVSEFSESDLSLGVETSADCEALQRDIDAVGDWSSENRLPFNIEKCKTISFSRKRQLINAAYTLSDAALQRVSDIRDLGLQLDSRLNFHDHVTAICKKANKMLGFVMRTSSEFNNLGVATVLYNAYIRSKLEYGGIVWAPSEEKYNIMLERVQRKFARWLYKKRYGYYPYLYPSSFVAGMVDLETLKFRRVVQTIVHYLSIVHHKVDNPIVLGMVRLLVPKRLAWNEQGTVAPRRRPRLLWWPQTRTNYALHAPTVRALGLIEDMIARDNDIDIFADHFKMLCAKTETFVNNYLM
ncbi:hypothetical protein HF086_011047 [Spodoptera exigua]|uniref:Endonuclease/exonuclease/phosphatase domain-containing protein n=1 Tax=Spodoptera exigua TaxID=7107 RepID=A0A922MC25_SPOEX|nr:hypothetical protein HF086_011047 [Spodoptera exigua]